MANFRALLPLSFLLLFSACTEPDAGSSGLTRTDSAGIEIVEHSMEMLTAVPGWALAPDPTVDIGIIDGPEEYQLFQVYGGSVLPGDTILVVNGGTQELRFYDPKGGFVRSTGGDGEGPGEFRTPIGVWHFGDSMAVWGYQLRRLAVYNRQGEFIRQASPERKGLNPRLLGVFSDGSMLVQDSWYEGLDQSMKQMYLHLGLFDGDGSFVDSLPKHPLALMGRLGESRLVGGPLFGARTSTAADSRSYWIGTGLAPEVRRFDPQGAPIQIVRWADEDRSVPQEEIDHYWAEEFAQTPEERRGQTEELRRSMPVSESFPVFELLQSTRENGLWIQIYRRPQDLGPDRWLVADRSGEIVAKIETPEGFRMMEIGEDYIAGVYLDELDVEHFAVYPILKE